jgi:glucose/arabinose dehydrogenase
MTAAPWLMCVALLSAGADIQATVVHKAKDVRGLAVADGRLFALAGGALVTLEGNQAKPVATGLEQPRGLGTGQGALYFVDKQRVRKLDAKGKLEDLAALPPAAGPIVDLCLHPENGTVFVCDEDAIYRIDAKGKLDVLTDRTKAAGLDKLRGLTPDGGYFLLVLDAAGVLQRINLATRATTRVTDGLGQGGRLCWDPFGRLYVGDTAGGRVFVIPRPGEKAVVMSTGLPQPSSLCLEAGGKRILVACANEVVALPTTVPGAEVDERPLALAPEVAFPDLRWTGWKGETDAGLPLPLRPLVLTHAGDGSNRVFVAIQQGTIHVFPNDQKAKQTRLFLDIGSKVRYDDKTNEEGLLGLAFHPRYKDNGQFFVFYTDKRAKMTNVLSRFRVSKEDPDRADPNSEEELLRIERPFWNHDGGTIVFGPDGYLYVALGDGGAANDPNDNGQNLNTLLGSVLRLDIDRKANDKPYGIPKDNPFVTRKDARPEIWAYGLRNVWRMAFDRKTGKLWAGDVGQNLYEEIDILRAGGNYGWKRREAMHPFEPNGSGPRPEFIEPIWEYRHDVGRSITGGTVYRGKRLPELDGAYLYGDYVSTKLWALWYDEAKGRVVANRPIRDRNHALLSFGEDEQGDAYYLTHSTSGQGIYRFSRSAGGDR